MIERNGDRKGGGREGRDIEVERGRGRERER